MKPQDFFRHDTEKSKLCLCHFFSLKARRKCLSNAYLTLVEGQGFQPASETVEARENTSMYIVLTKLCKQVLYSWNFHKVVTDER